MAQAHYSAYDYITQNNRKTWLLVLLFPISFMLIVSLACLAAVFLVGDMNMLIEGTHFLPQKLQPVNASKLSAALGFAWSVAIPTLIAAFVWLAISYFFGDKMMMSLARAKAITKQDAPKLYRTVQNVAMMSGLPCPQVYIIEDDSLNAFASGHNPKTASIAITRGLLEKLTPLELEGVIAHEMAHICNRDIRLNMLIITGLGVFGFIGEYLFRSGLYSNRNKKSNSKSSGQAAVLVLFIALAFVIFNYLVAPLIQMAVSRTREYAADATGAKIIHNPKALADALEKINGNSNVASLKGQKMMALACIAPPFALKGMMSTHPPIEDRIKKLRAM